MIKLSFLGAAGTVTGSKYLIEHEGYLILVDCGLFQGLKYLRLKNWEPFPFKSAKVSAVVLTHAHLDHSGALPLLIKQGFRGLVYATQATRETCELLLPDSGHLQEEDASYANRHHTSKHKPALPLYTEEEGRHALKHFAIKTFNTSFEVAPGFHARFRPAGHILGASSVEINVANRTILFSGDLGRPDDLVMRAPSPIDKADYLIVESTYGDRIHEPIDPENRIGEIITRTAARGGKVIIPAFAVGRAQMLLYYIFRLKTRGAIPDLPVFLNSPMAIDMTNIYRRHQHEHRLSIEECRGMCNVAQMVRTVEESQALNNLTMPAVIISASGMATGGRVLHHLKVMAPDARNTILFAGYQAAGTRGARMVAGEKSIRIFGEEVPIRAEVVSLHNLSAHADAQQIMQWLQTAHHPPHRVYVTHGEPAAADALRERIDHTLGWSAHVPELGEMVTLDEK